MQLMHHREGGGRESEREEERDKRVGERGI